MKKVLVIVLALAVCITGTAIAAPRKNPAKRPAPARMERMNPDAQNMPRGPRFGHGIFTPDMPKEIREKAAELAKLRIDLEEAMTSRPVNKEKALDVHAKIQKVQQDIETWRFTQRLERIEAGQKKEDELWRKMPPHIRKEAGMLEEENTAEPEKSPETPETESAE